MILGQSLQISKEVDSKNLRFYNSIKLILQEHPSDAKFLIEVNGNVKSTRSKPKPGNIANSGKKQHGADGYYWLTVQASLPAIVALIEGGYILRYGVKIGGTDYQNHFQEASFVYLDFDLGRSPQESIEQFNDSAFCIYRSPGWDGQNNKHRVVFRLSQVVKHKSDIQALLHALIKAYPDSDPSCVDPARICFGSFYPVIWTNFTNTLDIDKFSRSEEYLNFQATLNQIESKALNPAEDVRHHKDLIKCLVGDFEGDMNAFLKSLGLTYEFNFKKVVADFDGLKWEGRNPFSETNSTGTSLVASVKDGRILFYDRASGEHGCSIFGFYDSCVKDESILADSLYRSEFDNVVKAIKNKLKINWLDAKSTLYYVDEKGNRKLKDILNILHQYIYPELRGNLYRVDDIDDGVFLGYNFYYYEESGWAMTQGFEKVRELIKNTFYKLFGYQMPSNILAMIKDSLVVDVPDWMVLKTPPKPDLGYVFFSNGAYNLKSKKLENYSNKLWYFSKLDYPYIKSTGQGIDKWTDALVRSGVSEDDIKIILSSYLLTMHNQFFRVNKVLFFYGTPKSGKTTSAQIFLKSKNCRLENCQDVKFGATESLSTRFQEVTVFDEVKQIGMFMEQLSSLIRDTNKHGVNYRYRQLGTRGIQKNKAITFIFTGEQLSMGSTTQINGIMDRMLLCEFKDASKVDETFIPWFNSGDDFLIYDLAAWAVEQVLTEQDYIAKIRELQALSREQTEQKDRLELLIATSDPFYEFCNTQWVPDPNWTGEPTADSISYTPTEVCKFYASFSGEDVVSRRSRMSDIIQRFGTAMKKYGLHIHMYKDGFGQHTRYYGIRYILDQTLDNK
jgi:hypothetical protein